MKIIHKLMMQIFVQNLYYLKNLFFKKIVSDISLENYCVFEYLAYGLENVLDFMGLKTYSKKSTFVHSSFME